jgi:hypothetical protein
VLLFNVVVAADLPIFVATLVSGMPGFTTITFCVNRKNLILTPMWMRIGG